MHRHTRTHYGMVLSWQGLKAVDDRHRRRVGTTTVSIQSAWVYAFACRNQQNCLKVHRTNKYAYKARWQCLRTMPEHKTILTPATNFRDFGFYECGTPSAKYFTNLFMLVIKLVYLSSWTLSWQIAQHNNGVCTIAIWGIFKTADISAGQLLAGCHKVRGLCNVSLFIRLKQTFQFYSHTHTHPLLLINFHTTRASTAGVAACTINYKWDQTETQWFTYFESAQIIVSGCIVHKHFVIKCTVKHFDLDLCLFLLFRMNDTLFYQLLLINIFCYHFD